MRIAIWLSFAATLVTSGILSLTAILTPSLYRSRPVGMPLPLATEWFIKFGGYTALLAFPCLMFAVKTQQRPIQTTSVILYVSLALSICIILTIVSALWSWAAEFSCCGTRP